MGFLALSLALIVTVAKSNSIREDLDDVLTEALREIVSEGVDPQDAMEEIEERAIRIKFMGCFRRLTTYSASRFSSKNMRIVMCNRHCQSYKVFALTQGNTCVCGLIKNPKYRPLKYTSTRFCNVPCAGNKNTKCGGKVAK